MEQTLIKRVNRVLEHRGSILDIYTDYMELPDGKIEKWDYVEHRKGAAAVVPVLPDGRLLLVRQYRNALERFTLEIPAGSRDSVSEPTIECASRELEEETGYRCDNLEFLLSLRTTVAFCNEMVDVYVARNLIPSEQHLDEGEFIDLEPYTLEELCDLIYQGVIQDGKTVAGIMAYKNKYQK
ncbi:MAG: NUDIX hydrolase [Lachnospiraceae bacterium]|nr:NUDIX hydrolase [Lachnospiraceae bacterium]